MFGERIETRKERKKKIETTAKHRNVVVQLLRQLEFSSPRSRVEGLEPPSIVAMKG